MSDFALPPLALYVHLPWCVRKCPYCDFNSFRAPAKIDQVAYLDALLRDLDRDLGLVGERPVHSVFFGGGTPSLFAPEHLHGFVEAVKQRLPFTSACEVTLEANPGTVEHAPFKDYREAGINRVSLGVQSLDDPTLAVLGRIHSADVAHAAMEQLAVAGLRSYNVDLMFALPGQDVEAALRDVRGVLSHAPPHVSYYHLTLEPDTLFSVRPPDGLPSTDLADEIEQAGQQALAEAGYGNYEVSAWAKPGHACEHNLNYWRFGDYLGIGAGAHAKLTLPASGRIIRLSKRRHPGDFQRHAGSGTVVDQQRELVGADLAFDYMLNRLRLREPFSISDFQALTGLPATQLQPGLAQASAKQLLRVEGESIALTDLGWRFLNDTQQCFLPA